MACIPEECGQTWKLVRRNPHGCQSDIAMLSPGNDTRLNLLLFMADMHAERYKAALKTAKSVKGEESPLLDFTVFNARFNAQKDVKKAETDDSRDADDNSPGEGNYCPKTFDRADGFPGAVKADSALAPVERDALLAARLVLRCKEHEGTLAKAAQAATTPSGKAFADYLEAAKLFWAGDYNGAADAFTRLTNAENPWVRQTALYMLARVALQRAQKGFFDEYGDVKNGWKADKKLTGATEAALDAYLKAYPTGLYAASAQGLKRRVFWLEGRPDKLAREYGRLLAVDEGERNIDDVTLAQEIDDKLFWFPFEPGLNHPAPRWEFLSTSPALLAVFDLRRMREARNGPLTRPDLEAQKRAFAGNTALYEYLLAAHAFYVEKKPDEVLSLIPDEAGQTSFSYFEFSRQMLRGLALEAVKDESSLDFWMRMLPGATLPFQRPALELAIALHHERAGTVDKVFDADSPVRYPYLRQILLLNVADAALLRRQATNKNASRRERDKALFTLLSKEALHGRSPAGSHATDFLRDAALVPHDAPVDDGSAVMADGAVHTVDDKADEHPVPLGLFLRPIGGEFRCPSMIEVQRRLAKDPNDPRTLLCVADFVRLNVNVLFLWTPPVPWREFNMAHGESVPGADTLGGGPSRFPGGPHGRMAVYQAVLANPKADRDSKAYALYRSVRCYAPGGNNDCGGEDAPKALRKAWFWRLKKDYPASRWAKELKFYW